MSVEQLLADPFHLPLRNQVIFYDTTRPLWLQSRSTLEGPPKVPTVKSSFDGGAAEANRTPVPLMGAFFGTSAALVQPYVYMDTPSVVTAMEQQSHPFFSQHLFAPPLLAEKRGSSFSGYNPLAGSSGGGLKRTGSTPTGLKAAPDGDRSAIPKTARYRRVSALETSIVLPQQAAIRAHQSEATAAKTTRGGPSQRSHECVGGGGEKGRVMVLWNECAQQFGPNSEQWGLYGLGGLGGPVAGGDGRRAVGLYIIIDPLGGGLYRVRLYSGDGAVFAPGSLHPHGTNHALIG